MKLQWDFDRGKKYGAPDIDQSIQALIKDDQFFNWFYTTYVAFICADVDMMETPAPKSFTNVSGNRIRFLRTGDKIKVSGKDSFTQDLIKRWSKERPAFKRLVDKLKLVYEV